jgi:hypothetical protein
MWSRVGPAVRPLCGDCRMEVCVCHDRAHWAAQAAEQARAAAEAAQIAAISTAPPDVPVLIQRVDVPFAGGLVIEGVATSRLWDEGQVPLAAGLTTLRGSTTRYQCGREPRKMERVLPAPVWWMHQADAQIGWMIAARATRDILYFEAAVAPPGTPGYDEALLHQVWSDVRSGAVTAVSFTARAVRDGVWTPVELSLVHAGANPCAVITRAAFPDGHVVQRPEILFSAEMVREATRKHQEYHAARRKTESPRQQAIEAPPWNATQVYRMNAKVRYKDRTFCAMRDNCAQRPDGSGTVWRKLPVVEEGR